MSSSAASPAPEHGPQHSGADRAESAPRLRTSAEGVPGPIQIAAAWSWRLIVIAVGLYVVIRLLGTVTQVLIPVLLAALVASLIAPVARGLRRLRVPPMGASLLAIVGLIVAVLGLLGLAGQQIIVGFSQLSDSVVNGVNALIGMLEDLPFDFSTDLLNQYADQALNALQNNTGQIVSGAISFGSTAGMLLTGLFILLFTLIFFLADGERIWLFTVKLFPKPAQAAVNGSGRRAWISLIQYMRVQGLVALIDAIGIGLGAFILGVPLAVPLGILVFLGAWIPLVGAVVTGAVGVLVALVANGPIAALAMLGVVILVQQLEGNILQPLIMGQAVSLHPLAVFLAVASGSVVAGILGALFSVPLMAMVNSVVRYLSHRGWEDDPEIAWQPYYYPWEIERRAKSKDLTREEVLQQFRRFSRTRSNQEAKAHNKDVEKEAAERERDRALDAARQVQRSQEDLDGPGEELEGRTSDEPQPTKPPRGIETQQAARMPYQEGEDIGTPTPQERIVGGVGKDDPDVPPATGSDGSSGSTRA